MMQRISRSTIQQGELTCLPVATHSAMSSVWALPLRIGKLLVIPIFRGFPKNKYYRRTSIPASVERKVPREIADELDIVNRIRIDVDTSGVGDCRQDAANDVRLFAQLHISEVEIAIIRHTCRYQPPLPGSGASLNIEVDVCLRQIRRTPAAKTRRNSSSSSSTSAQTATKAS